MLRHVHPEVAQVSFCAARETVAAEEPKVSVRVRPATQCAATAGNIAREEHTLSAVQAVLVDGRGAGEPRPLTIAIFPDVV